ncbi:hypothetical protein BSU04_20190 [Caballeronia sordidicola]|uniref:Uncharacterized protein n=1 Tax=Caballeronia sordidicola TaxID=196367 RepID=A0A226X1K6_CABSO|nr:hypothetical protein BSU04_20190 [Caballeronia sordidicola]
MFAEQSLQFRCGNPDGRSYFFLQQWLFNFVLFQRNSP